MAKDKEFHLPSNIKPAPLGKSTLSFFIDFGLAAIVAVVLYFTIGRLVIAPAAGGDTLEKEQIAFIDRAGLVAPGGQEILKYSDTAETAPADYAYKKYVDVMWHYFTVSCISDSEMTPNVAVESTASDDTLTLPGYEGEKALTTEYGKWIYKNYFGYVDGATTNAFVPSEDGNFLSKPKAGKDETSFHIDLAERLHNVNKQTGHYIDAVKHLTRQPAYEAMYNKGNMIIYLATLPAATFPAITFFFAIPMILRDGKTLGKLICGLAVVGTDGFAVRRPLIAIRQFPIVAMMLLLAMPWYAITVPVFFLVMLLSYMFHVMSKKGQSLHDKIPSTIVVNAKTSMWFASAEERDAFVAEHPTSPVSKAILAEQEAATVSSTAALTSAMIEAQEQILDLSTINRRREEARTMTSFDEYERQSDAEFAAREAEAAGVGGEISEPTQEEVDAALADVAAMEGLTPEEAEALSHEGEEPVDDDAFVDEGTKK